MHVADFLNVYYTACRSVYMYVYIFLQQLERHWVWLFSCAQYKFFHMNNTTVVFVVVLAVYIIACCLSFRVCIDLCEFLLNKYNTEHWIAYAIIIYVFIYILVSYIYTYIHPHTSLLAYKLPLALKRCTTADIFGCVGSPIDFISSSIACDCLLWALNWHTKKETI